MMYKEQPYSLIVLAEIIHVFYANFYSIAGDILNETEHL